MFQILQSSLEHLSMKGVPRLIKSKGFCQRTLWLLTVVAGLGICLAFLVPLLMAYTAFETTITTSEERFASVFPGIFYLLIFMDGMEWGGVGWGGVVQSEVR